MTKTALLPFINKGVPKIVDHDGYGLIAYGSRFSIYIFDLRLSPPTILDSMVLLNCHNIRVASLSFCKTNSKLLASVGEDCILKIWDLETSSCIFSLQVKDYSRVVEWLYNSPDTVAFPDGNGRVSKWNFKSNSVVKLKTSSESLACLLSSNKRLPELLAVGHVVGSVSVLNLNSQTVAYRLKTHTMEITSLSWSLVSPLMLLSVSMDQSARLWKLGEDKPYKTYYYPTSRIKSDDKKKFKFCGLCHPENSDVIILSNVRGDLGSVTFTENEAPKFKVYDVKDFDSNYRTGFAMLPYCPVAGNGHCFVSFDNYKVSLWSISNETLLSSYVFSYGNINFLTVSANNPDLMAICAGDGFVRVSNARPEASRGEMTSVYVNYRIKIMCVAWHPIEENIIAYGSDEGRVGVVDIQKKRLLYSYETHHSGTVYSLQWGPCRKLQDSEETIFLYSVGGGSILVHELNKPKEKPADFDTLVTYPPDLDTSQKGCTELSWKSDYACLAVGKVKGFIDLFDNKLTFLARLNLQIKSVECIRWHPMYTFSSPNGSNYSSWLAASGIDDNVHIFDATDVLKGQSESVLLKSTRTLVGHRKKIFSVTWSPHNDGYLASTSKDGTVQVWNVITVTCIAIYKEHRDLVYAVQWSFFDPDIIYSGGRDNCLRIWKISEQSDTLTEKIKLVSHKYKTGDMKKPAIQDVKSSQEELSGTKTNINGTVEEFENDTEDKGKPAAKINYKSSKGEGQYLGKGQLRNLFPEMNATLCTREESLEDFIKLTDLFCDQQDSDSQNSPQVFGKVTDEESLKFGFFADQFTALRMLETRAKIEEATNKSEKATYLQFMACNAASLLTAAAEKKQLNDFLVASAPTVSYKFWHEMCEKYAFQLVDEQSYMKASLYFLFCGKLYDAIHILLEKNKIFEALALAKARLPDDDPYLPKVYRRVINQFAVNHMVIHEASCHLALKEPLQAAKILYSSGDPKNIYAAVYMCKKFNLTEEAKTYGYFCMEKCLSMYDWPTFYKVSELIDSLKVYKILVRVHEILTAEVKKLKKDDGKIFGITGNNLLIWEGKIYEDSNLSFLSHVCGILKNEGTLSEDKESLEEIHKALNSMDIKRKQYEIPSEVHINMAMYVTQVIVTSFLGDLCLTSKYLTKIFSTSYNIAFLPRVMCQLLLPLDIYWCCNEDTFICESKLKNIDILPFTAHFHSIYLSVCDKFASIGKTDTKDFFTFQSMPFDLNMSVQQVLSIFSKKTTEDTLLLYFCAFYLNVLRRQAKSGWKFRCYIAPITKSSESLVLGNEIAVENTDEQSTQSIPEQTGNCQNRVEEKSDESVSSSSVIDEKFEDVPGNELASNNINDEHTTLPTYCVPKETEECENGAEAKSDESASLSNESPRKDENFVEQNTPPIKCIAEQTENYKNEADETIVISASKIVDIHENKSSENDINNIKQNISSLENVPKQTETYQNDMKEISDKTATLNDTVVSENIDDKLYASGITDKVNSEANVPNLENANSANQNISFNCEIIEINSEDEYDHLQCWSDISLYYILTKSFISAICKDEYALQSYLQKCLHQLDVSIANLTRQKSTKPVKSNESNISLKSENSNKCDGSKGNSPSDQKHLPQENDLQHSADSNLISGTITKADEENKCHSFAVSESAFQENKANVKNDNGDTSKSGVTPTEESKCDIVNGNALQIKEISTHEENDVLKTETIPAEESKCYIASSALQVNESSANEENGVALKTESTPSNESKCFVANGSILQANEIGVKKESGDTLKSEVTTDSVEEDKSSISAQQENENDKNEDITLNKVNLNGIDNKLESKVNIIEETGEHGEMPAATNTDAAEKVSEINAHVSSVEIIEPECTSQKTVCEKLQAEHDKISEQIKLLNLEEFCYPNPFDAVSAVNGICCDIFRKNPCKLIKVKFHELAHEINKWSAKFCTKDETLTCAICQEKISA